MISRNFSRSRSKDEIVEIVLKHFLHLIICENIKDGYIYTLNNSLICMYIVDKQGHNSRKFKQVFIKMIIKLHFMIIFFT